MDAEKNVFINKYVKMINVKKLETMINVKRLEKEVILEADLDEKITVCSNKYHFEFKGRFFEPIFEFAEKYA